MVLNQVYGDGLCSVTQCQSYKIDCKQNSYNVCTNNVKIYRNDNRK